MSCCPPAGGLFQDLILLFEKHMQIPQINFRIIIGILLVLILIFLVLIFQRFRTQQNQVVEPTNQATLSIVPTQFVGQTILTQSPQTSLEPTVEIQKSPQDLELVKESEEFYRTQHPDVFLSNQCPHVQAEFELTTEFVKGDLNHFAFFFAPKIENRQAATDALNVWLKSLGLTQRQINNLDLRVK